MLVVGDGAVGEKGEYSVQTITLTNAFPDAGRNLTIFAVWASAPADSLDHKAPEAFKPLRGDEKSWPPGSRSKFNWPQATDTVVIPAHLKPSSIGSRHSTLLQQSMPMMIKAGSSMTVHLSLSAAGLPPGIHTRLVNIAHDGEGITEAKGKAGGEVAQVEVVITVRRAAGGSNPPAPASSVAMDLAAESSSTDDGDGSGGFFSSMGFGVFVGLLFLCCCLLGPVGQAVKRAQDRKAALEAANGNAGVGEYGKVGAAAPQTDADEDTGMAGNESGGVELQSIRGGGLSAEGIGPQQWACEQCTFLNDPSLNVCGACEGARGPAPAPAAGSSSAGFAAAPKLVDGFVWGSPKAIGKSGGGGGSGGIGGIGGSGGSGDGASIQGGNAGSNGHATLKKLQLSETPRLDPAQ
jgi:hypothetical protein